MLPTLTVGAMTMYNPSSLWGHDFSRHNYKSCHIEDYYVLTNVSQSFLVKYWLLFYFRLHLRFWMQLSPGLLATNIWTNHTGKCPLFKQGRSTVMNSQTNNAWIDTGWKDKWFPFLTRLDPHLSINVLLTLLFNRSDAPKDWMTSLFMQQSVFHKHKQCFSP